MSFVLPTVSPDLDDLSCPDTPVAPSVSQIPTIEAPELLPTVDQLDGPSLASTLKLPDSSSQFLSPIAPSKPEFRLADVDVLGSEGTRSLEVALGLESGTVDITVAVDGSFIETSSGPVARELKRRYDQLLGVGPSVRSPYAITGFINQHGRDMYRIGHRDASSAPAASAAEVEDRIVQSKNPNDPSHSPKTKRRSRLSMHFPAAMFTGTKPPPTTTSRPPTANSATSSGRKLRKTRSIPDMFGTEPIVTNAPTFAVTGRAHSQSVTAADLPRPSLPFNIPPERRIDAFGELMEWFNPASSASSNFSSHSLFNPGKVSSDPARPRASITQPFGLGVAFDSPSRRPALDRLPTPRHLRVMQSFDSSVTARQDDPHDDVSDTEMPMLDESNLDDGIIQPTSAVRLSMLSLTPSEPFEAEVSQLAEEEPTSSISQNHNFAPSVESLRLSSHYSTEVFNVLQTYRGLPTFENLVPESDEGATVIRLSLAADQSATPRDDPRFVIWGQITPEHETEDHYPSSRDSFSGASPTNHSTSSVSRRRSSKVSRLMSPETTTSKLPEAPAPRVLIAATIERWIAQLTSDLNYDELLNFFLTYRTYCNAVDLCHLFICRFHWALQQPSSLQDETVRRIVRVRTFVAIRYWLLTFFTVDFIPNRELRLLIADWLNTLIGDPILKRHVDAIDIVRRLIKVAKECRRIHTHTADKPKNNLTPKESVEQPVEHVLGKSFAEAIRKAPVGDNVSELDLDFLPDEAKVDDTAIGFPNDPANAHLTSGNAIGGILAGNRPASLPLSSLSILQRTEHAPGPPTEAEMQYIQNGTVQLSMKHSALSRAFVRTIGRLGRWKRALNPKSSVRPTSVGACGVGVSAFDLDVSASRDLLSMPDGVEEFLKQTEPAVKSLSPPVVLAGLHTHQTLSSTPTILPIPLVHSTSSSSSKAIPLSNGNYASPLSPLSLPVQDPIDTHDFVTETPPLQLADDDIPMAVTANEHSEEALVDPVPQAPVPIVALEELHNVEDDFSASESLSLSSRDSYVSEEIDRLREPSRAYSFRSSSSTDSFGAPLTSDGPLPPTFPGHHNQWQFDVVSIDDLDFSDTSSLPPTNEDPAYPPGLRKPPRKLPTRREFEFVRRSEVSSMGIVSHESMRDSFASSTHSETSPTSSGPKGIHKWQMKSLQQTFESMSNDEDDNGDVEAALRRLEGHINPKVQQEKAEKVDGWVRTLQERMANGDYDYESSLFSEDEVEGFFDEVDYSAGNTTVNSDQLSVVVSGLDNGEQEEISAAVNTPIPTQMSHQIPSPTGPISPLETTAARKDNKPALEDVVPLEILQSRVPPMEPSSSTSPPAVAANDKVSSKFVNSDGLHHHSSFILHYSAEVLAQHFSMIDRELFMSVKFEELVNDDWIECEEINVLDWALYLKDRARWKVEGRNAEKTTALAALRARFNLMVSFVISEIVLTAPSDRPVVVAKFVRIAWRSYSMSNFHTLTAIITALQNNWVSRAMRKPGWSRIGMFESRMLKDLKLFTSNVDDFKFMRQIVDSIVDSKPLDSSNHASSVISGGDSQSGKGKATSDNRPAIPSSCIPFIGIYLSQLYRHNKLPALIDPTAPNSVIGIDPETAIFDPPAHPEVFSNLAPLPASMHLEPLINVQKQRRIADVIKSLVAGQHLASRIQFDVDKRLFHKCLRLRGLDDTTLHRAFSIYQD